MTSCKKCGLSKKVKTAFYASTRKNGKTYLSVLCKKCTKEVQKEKYDREPELFRSRAREAWRGASGFYTRDRRKGTIRERRELINKAKAETPCKDCGNKFHPVAMDFDHRGNKTVGIAYMAGHGYSLEKIQEEIDKCDVVCANCHRIRTWVTKTTGHLKGKTT